MKKNILFAGLQALREFKARDLTAPSIAKLIGIKQGHLTYYFPRRTELFSELGRFAIEQLQMEHQSENPEKQFQLEKFIGWFFKDPSNRKVVHNLLFEVEENPHLRELTSEKINSFKKLLQGHFKSHSDEELLLLISQFLGLAMLYFFSNEKMSDELNAAVRNLQRKLTLHLNPQGATTEL